MERHRNRWRKYSFPYGRIRSRMTASIVYFGLAMHSRSSSLTYIADFDPEMKETF